MIDLRSDTVTLPSKKMKKYIFESKIGDDVYKEDPTVNALEEEIADLFGRENSLYVPSGTMANLISILTHCNRGEEILLGDKSHIFKYEAGGVSAFGGIHSHQLKNNQDGTINLHDIKENIRNYEDLHFPKTKLVCLENTHNLCYGAAIDVNYFSDVKNILKDENIKIHIDGARIFNASVKLKKTVKDLTKDANSISCCLSKGLAAPVGSMIVGSNSFIAKARRIRKALGGGMRQAGIIAAGGRYGVKNMIERLEEDHEMALSLAKQIDGLDEIQIDLKNVHTNIVFFNLNTKKITDNDFKNELLNYNVKIDYKGQHKFRMVTHFGLEKTDIEKVASAFKSILK